jgi:hypothetical protein
MILHIINPLLFRLERIRRRRLYALAQRLLHERMLGYFIQPLYALSEDLRVAFVPEVAWIDDGWFKWVRRSYMDTATGKRVLETDEEGNPVLALGRCREELDLVATGGHVELTGDAECL